uniref:Uncharacterized protein n=1 Tax=Globodera rostochiensis TaxID=31243 RepID=A0A914HWI6_GLORO
MANDNILFISGVVLLALAIDFSPAPACTTVIIFALYKYRSELYELLPPEFFDVLKRTRALYMTKLKRWFPDWQEMPCGIGAVYDSFKKTLIEIRDSTTLAIIPACSNLPNLAKTILDAISIRPGLLNRARRVFIGAVLIFAVGSLFIYDLKTIVSTYILLAFIAVFVKFGFDNTDDSG